MTTSSRLPTEERQAAIVTAALELARETSPALITTSDIAAGVGVTQGALFKHFPTKDAIWLAAMGWVRRQLLATLESSAAKAASPMDALAGMFKAHVAFIVSHPGVPRFIFHELQRTADSPVKQEARKLLQGYRKLVRKHLDAAVAAGQVSAKVDAEAAATLFVGVVQGLVMQSMLSGQPAAMKTQADAAFAIYRRGIERTP